MLRPHRPFRTVIEDRKINFSIGKSVFHFAVVKNTLKLADFIGHTKKKKKSLHFPVRLEYRRTTLFCFPDSERHCLLFAWNNWITCLYDRGFEIEINLVPTNVVLVKISIQQERSRNNHCSVKNCITNSQCNQRIWTLYATETNTTWCALLVSPGISVWSQNAALSRTDILFGSAHRDWGFGAQW